MVSRIAFRIVVFWFWCLGTGLARPSLCRGLATQKIRKDVVKVGRRHRTRALQEVPAHLVLRAQGSGFRGFRFRA